MSRNRPMRDSDPQPGRSRSRGGNSLEREAKRAARGSKLRIQAPNNCAHCGRTIPFGRGGEHHRRGRCTGRGGSVL